MRAIKGEGSFAVVTASGTLTWQDYESFVPEF